MMHTLSTSCITFVAHSCRKEYCRNLLKKDLCWSIEVDLPFFHEVYFLIMYISKIHEKLLFRNFMLNCRTNYIVMHHFSSLLGRIDIPAKLNLSIGMKIE